MKKSKPINVNDCFYGAVTVGERGQVVVPADARHELDIKPGDKLVIMRHPFADGLIMARFQEMRDMLEDMQRQLDEVQDVEEGVDG